MGALISFFRNPSSCRRAQSSGLSPSPTDEVGEKAFGLTEGSVNEESKVTKQTLDDVKPPEEPESNDTSYGVEATAVRTLAASTGTVAILGTTAKALESSEPVSEEILSEERFKDNPSISVTEAEPEPEESDAQEIKETVNIPDVHKESHEDLHNENSVVQQKEIKQIENEALQEKEQSVCSSHFKKGPEPDEIEEQVIVEEKSEEAIDATIPEEHPPEKLLELEVTGELPERVPRQTETLNETEAPTKQESQLPKIVDFQEKKTVPLLAESEKLDDVSTPITKSAEEKEVILLPEIEDKALKETLVVKLDESKINEKEKTLPTEEEEVVKEEIVHLSEKQDKDLGEKESEDNKKKDKVERSEIEGTSDNEPSPAGTEFPSPSEDEGKVLPDSERLSPDISKTEDDNEISSEQLKTNSLSDMSISEGVNSEGEEAAREAAKALELQEMVASLSASANEAAFDFREATTSEENIVGTSSRKASEKEMATHETIIEEKLSPETNGEDSLPEFPEKRDEDSHKMMAFESPDSSEPPSNESNASSKPTEESKISDKDDVIESESIIDKKSENNIIDENEIDEVKNQDNKTAEDNYEQMAAAATTIQSSFRGYKARKDLKVSEKDGSLLTATDATYEGDVEIPNNKDEQDSPGISDDVFLEKDLEESPEKSHHHSQYSPENPSEEIDEQITVQAPEVVDSVVANAPESLVRIAQAEVDRICLEAEQTTESMILPPPIVDPDAIESGYQDDNEEFPAPPDDLLDMNGKTETMKDDQDSSGTEPTIPLGTTDDGDSSKTEDTTAPSFAESEAKSNAATPTHKNEDNKLESSITENVNTEVAINRDSTEGELTMEEDSKEEDIGSVLQTAKEKDMQEKSNESEGISANQEKAAIVIQASFRGFKTRQDLKKDVKQKGSTPENESKPNTLPATSDSIETEAGENLTGPQPSEGRPKRPDQIDVVPKHEQPPEGILLSDDISLPEYSLSESKDDTSSTTLSEEELNEKASKIQAGVRGYLVRKEQKAQKEAAIKIQSTYRGFKARKRLKQEEAS